ncbi:MAG: NfeD family protein [Peptococcaceae bacterium]|nr:ATP-dependent Clp protease proteolytic subunit [Peptococcaceae bacterium]MDH7524517.1 NfeD family protein [Peptococcaceae bacterium]
MKIKGRLLYGLVLLFAFLAAGLHASPAQLVYVVPVQGTIDPGQARFVERSYREAGELKATMVLLEVDTPGGMVDAALKIRDTIRRSPVPTTALVRGGAISAGALITLACEKIAMEPGSTIGAAEPRIGAEKADEKYISYFSKEMASTAETNGRRPDIAVAMVDRDKEIPGLVEKGKLLTLTYLEAEKYGYADYIVKDRSELLAKLDLAGAQVKESAPSLPERLARVLTNPFVAPLLLTIGIAGIVIEIFTVGWGVAGTVGLISLGLYFAGNLLAGFTGWEALLLFLLGIILLGVEAVVPGFGIPGIGGIACLTVSIIMAAPSWEAGIISLVFALVGTIILLFLSFKILNRRKFWNRLVLGTSYKKEDGYIPQAEDLSRHIGARGTAHTILRPAGTVVLEDGTRLDVVADGEYIARGEKIEVVRVEGIRVIVQPVREQ